MKTIREILGIKGNAVYTVTPATLVLDAVKSMAEKKIGALVVTDENNILGIITEQDFTRRVVLKDINSENTPVESIMSKDVAVIHPEKTINQGMAIMTEKRIRHLPVIDKTDGKNELIGLVSIGDLVKEVISEQEHIIEQLEHYIHS